MLYFKRPWNESRGDEHNDWGPSIWYFETDAEMWPNRQMEVYANGKVLKYEQQHQDDKFGGLSEVVLDEYAFAPFVITCEEFETAWNSLIAWNGSR